MDTQRSLTAASAALLLFAAVALLLLTVHVEEIQDPPQYMVMSYLNHYLISFCLLKCPFSRMTFESLSRDRFGPLISDLLITF